jgi:hypothetical protein
MSQNPFLLDIFLWENFTEKLFHLLISRTTCCPPRELSGTAKKFLGNLWVFRIKNNK